MKKIFIAVLALMFSGSAFAVDNNLLVDSGILIGSPVDTGVPDGLEFGYLTQCGQGSVPGIGGLTVKCQVTMTTDHVVAFGNDPKKIILHDGLNVKSLSMRSSWYLAVGTQSFMDDMREIPTETSYPVEIDGVWTLQIVHYVACADFGGVISGVTTVTPNNANGGIPVLDQTTAGHGTIFPGCTGVTISDEFRIWLPFPEWEWNVGDECDNLQAYTTWGQFSSHRASGDISFKMPTTGDVPTCYVENAWTAPSYYKTFGFSFCLGASIDYSDFNTALLAGRISYRLNGGGLCKRFTTGMEP